MAVDEFELFHGVVFTKLLRSQRPVTLRLIETKPGEAWSAYTINDEIDLFIKHSASPRLFSRGKGGKSWSFVFGTAQLAQMAASAVKRPLYVALVGGSRNIKDTMKVCLLEPDQITELVDFSSSTTQAITVRYIPRGKLRVFKDKREVSCGADEA
jgi:hypothetical protein